MFLVNPELKTYWLLSYLSWIPWVSELRMPECRIAFREALNIGGGMESTTSFFQATFWSPKNEGHLTPEKVTRKNPVMINGWFGVCLSKHR